MKKNSANIISSVIASIYSTILIINIINCSKALQSKKNISSDNEMAIFTPLLVLLFVSFMVLSFSKWKKVVVYVGLVGVLSMILMRLFYYFDRNYTYNHEFSYTIFNFFGWYNHNSEYDKYDHLYLGMEVVIYPVILVFSYLLIYSALKKFINRVSNRFSTYEF